MSPDAESKANETTGERLATLREVSFLGFRWSVLAELSTRAIQPIVTLVLARLLSPADFGVVAVATVVISLSQLFQDFGLGKAVIQTDDRHQEYANNAFWMNVIFGSIIYLLILFFASDIAQVFKSPESTLVLQVLCVQLLLTSVSAVHGALLQRSVQFNKLFIVRLVSAGIPGLVSIPFALNGFGVWALVGGTLAGAITQLVMYWRLSDWRPKFSFDLDLAKQMLRFSRWVAGEGVAGWLISWGDSVVLGVFLGVTELGFYRLGMFFVVFISHVFFTPFVAVALSFLSRLQSSPEEFRKYFIKISRVITVIVVPIGVIVALFAKPIILLILGEKWKGTEVVLATMSLRWALGCLVGLNATGFTALGRPDVNVKLLAIVVVFTIPIYFLAAPYGLLFFCLARLLTAQIDNVINYLYGIKIMDLKPRYLWDNLSTALPAIGLTTFVSSLYVYGIGVGSIPGLILGLGLSLIVYVLALWIFQRDFTVWGVKNAFRLIGI